MVLSIILGFVLGRSFANSWVNAGLLGVAALLLAFVVATAVAMPERLFEVPQMFVDGYVQVYQLRGLVGLLEPTLAVVAAVLGYLFKRKIASSVGNSDTA